ncbi:hypothetical protein ACFC0C_16205 [Streptomyces sp. NPDC056178]|uniref:hypothetical protein n=1 Tax=unclassified Streptomyces TaxID=2593676 RepID=UPI0035D94E78
MSNATHFDEEHLHRTIRGLAHPGLIRLISEIDDNGPLQRRMTRRTLADLSRHQVQAGLEIAGQHGLVGTHSLSGEPCYVLTDAGTGLADIYDTLARWARAHDYPERSCDFVTRIQATLTLLNGPLVQTVPTDAGTQPPPSIAALALEGPWAAFVQWVQTHAPTAGAELDRAA